MPGQPQKQAVAQSGEPSHAQAIRDWRGTPALHNIRARPTSVASPQHHSQTWEAVCLDVPHLAAFAVHAVAKPLRIVRDVEG